MDNEQPWQPPRQHSAPPIIEVMRVTPQVPELTLFSPTNRQQEDATTKNKNNFFQRIFQSNHPKPKTTTVPIISQTQQGINSVQPAVPDVTILDNQMIITPTTRKSTNDKAACRDNIYERMPKPSVPDVTILDDEPKVVEAPKQQKNRVFDENYKQMLIDSHESFMKQIRDEKEPEKLSVAVDNKSTKNGKKATNNLKSNLFNMKQYQENPLRKYAPQQPNPLAWDMKQVANLDSSSILVEGEFESNKMNEEEKCDEKTFKKVAEMLNQIQKLTSSTTSPTTKTKEPVQKVESCSSKILKQLALKYLTQDEQIFFDVENELKELEENYNNECPNS